ncbi:MAG: cysteine hydrolase family protein [Dethiobacteria bacterium]|jgi:nicotinamidase/pyrazinamidase
MARALLIIDMLRDFLERDGSLYIGAGSKAIIQNVAARLKEWRLEEKPVIYIMDSHLQHDPEFEMFPAHCLAGEWGGEVVDELAPREEDFLISKRRYSAFFGTDLDLTLRELGVQELELTGVCTQICVLYTAADARMRHYDVTVRKNCVASFDQETHEFALKEMEKTLGVKVI